MAAIDIVDAPVHTRVTVGDSEVGGRHAVFCVRQLRSVPFDDCTQCPHAAAIPHRPRAGAIVQCRVPHREPHHMDIPERAVRASLGEIMRVRVACVTPETDWDAMVRLLLDEGCDALPVIDGNGRPMGIVTKTDLLERARDPIEETEVPTDPRGFHLDARRAETADDVMTPLVHALPEDAPLSFAMALLALERVDQIPVVSKTGAVVGLLTAGDCVGWMARQLGYVIEH